MAAWERAHRLPLGAEIALAFATGVGTFALAAVVLAHMDSRVVAAVLGVVCFLAVVATARFVSVVYAVPAGMAGMLAFDWFYLPPTHPFAFPDTANLVDLVVYLVVGVVLGELAAHTARRARAAEWAHREIADEQVALRRVATLVAKGVPADDFFASVAAEAGTLLDVHGVRLARYEHGTELVHVAEWSLPGCAPPAYQRTEVEGTTVAAEVLRTGRAVRVDDYEDVATPFTRGADLKSVVGVPVVVDNRRWGVLIAWSVSGPLPPETEVRLTGFTELVATAIANAQARVELRSFAEEQAALRRVATMVAGGAAPAETFGFVAGEVGRLLGADVAVVFRYEPDGVGTVVGVWSVPGVDFPGTARMRVAGGGTAATVLATGRPVRTEHFEGPEGSIANCFAHLGARSGAGAPITVEGRLWGVMIAVSRAAPLPAGAEARLAGFTDLVATALADADARAALTASRVRIVAAADTARRRIERDLHDGAQQRLVSLALHLRGSVQRAVPPGSDDLTAQLDRVVDELGEVLGDLREIARGLHPAALAEGGLGAAVKTLARRSAVPVRLDIRVGTRLPEPIELAAYYTVSEALTNTAKHADAEVVDVEVRTDDSLLHVVVRDDGRGGADTGGGSGLVGLKDRVEALGGRFSVHSPPDAGTSLCVSLPLAAPHEHG
ncbi:GAF domain-containing protein [Pseudonocardia xinjiangensis]|uniref:GAF domain-containing protein n=1 Tax=Pseudonocardia xinjiangensis TaxID=75289 RepID=UPI003D8BED3D